jgi:hypothetical protein
VSPCVGSHGATSQGAITHLVQGGCLSHLRLPDSGSVVHSVAAAPKQTFGYPGSVEWLRERRNLAVIRPWQVSSRGGVVDAGYKVLS